MKQITRWLGPLSGVAGVAVVFVSQGISGGTDSEPSDSPTAILAEFRHSGDDIELGSFVAVLGLGLLLIYFGHMRTRLEAHGASWAANVFSIGGVALVGALLVFVGANLTGAEAGDQGHTEVALGVIDFTWNGVWLFTPGLLALGAAVALAAFADRALPLWLGAFGVLVALSALAPWIGAPIFAIWVLAASIEELVALGRGRQDSIDPTTSAV